MKALVTGAAGFVGGYLCAHLREAGDDVIDAGDVLGGFDVTDAAVVHDTFARTRPEVVYHLAALSDVAASWRDPVASMRVNAEGTLHVVAAARRHGAERVLVVGSAEEYGRVDPALPAVTEDAPLRPITPYGVSKVAASFVALQAWLGSALPTIRVRPFNHTGPGQRADFLVPALAARIAEAEDTGSRTVAVGALDPVRDLTDVRDVVRAYRLLVAHAREGEVYNVCRGTGVTVGELARRMLASARGPCELRTDPGLVRPVEVPRLVGDATKLRRATGWEPRIDLDDTLAAVLEHARAARAPGQSS